MKVCCSRIQKTSGGNNKQENNRVTVFIDKAQMNHGEQTELHLSQQPKCLNQQQASWWVHAGRRTWLSGSWSSPRSRRDPADPRHSRRRRTLFPELQRKRTNSTRRRLIWGWREPGEGSEPDLSTPTCGFVRTRQDRPSPPSELEDKTCHEKNTRLLACKTLAKGVKRYLKPKSSKWMAKS